MVERRRDARLAQEALAEAAVLGELRRDHLQRHLPPQPSFLGTVNRAHPAPADERLDEIAGELAPDHRVGALSHAHRTSVLLPGDTCNDPGVDLEVQEGTVLGLPEYRSIDR